MRTDHEKEHDEMQREKRVSMKPKKNKRSSQEKEHSDMRAGRGMRTKRERGEQQESRKALRTSVTR